MAKHIQIGLKLHSTNTDLIPEAEKLQDLKFLDFVELYVIPESFESSIQYWQNFDAKFIIHAPHSYHGINFAQSDKQKTNLKNFNIAKCFAEELDADFIVIHGGNDGLLSESIKQIKALGDNRIVIENKPKISLDGKLCVGYSPEEFAEMDKAGILHGIALDFGHAVCAANALEIDALQLVKELIRFNPKLFHLSDGVSSSKIDVHLNIGKGDLRISDFLSLLSDGSMVTIETPRLNGSLNDFMKDATAVRELIGHMCAS